MFIRTPPEGLSLRQTYTVTQAKGAGAGATRSQLASGLIVSPINVEPWTMPDYPSLLNQAIESIPGESRWRICCSSSPVFLPPRRPIAAASGS